MWPKTALNAKRRAHAKQQSNAEIGFERTGARAIMTKLWRNMKKTRFRDEHKIFALSIVTGLSVIVMDAAIDAFIFNVEPFLDWAIFKVPINEIYQRCLLLAIFMLYGAVASRLFAKRRKAEETLRVSEEKFKKLFVDNPEPAVYLDQGFHILDTNPRFTALFGYPLNEIKGKHINDVVVPKEKMKEAEMLDWKTGDGAVYHDSVRKRKNGSLIPVSISAAQLIVNDQLLGYVVLYKDISELKKTEKELKDALEKLKAANEKLTVVGRLTRHDIRNKLSAITGNVYLSKQKLAVNREVLDYVKGIDLACEKIVRILDFASAYEMLGVEELVYIDVGETLEEAVSLFSDLKGTKIINDCRELVVLADSLLRQILYNLIDNSLKYGGEISQIKVYFEEADDQLRLIYEDDGEGIPENVRRNLFKEGFGRGTGYGLYLIKKICEVYGWVIEETGRHGKGAQFTITIPKINNSGKANYKLH